MVSLASRLMESLVGAGSSFLPYKMHSLSSDFGSFRRFVFAAWSSRHFNHSAAIIFQEFKKRGQYMQRRMIQEKSTMFGTAIIGQECWQHSVLSLGSWLVLSNGLGRSHHDHDENKMTMASLESTPFISKPSRQRFWTNVLIGLNVFMFLVQEASHGKLLLLGAKINSLIDHGQLWRFVTPAFLHANVAHLLTNCYSLNSLGPGIEAYAGPHRFLAIYFGSAVTGFYMSYTFSRASAVGASGAVFGLMGSLAVFFLRHRHLFSGAKQSLSQLIRVIAVNLIFGLAVNNIDNWGHLGGLLGGAALSWILGPALSLKQIPGHRKRVLIDQPPISYLLPQTRSSHL